MGRRRHLCKLGDTSGERTETITIKTLWDNGKNVRRDDHDTSRAAANKAHPDSKTAAMIRDLMRDGQARTDEEIADGCNACGVDLSPDRFRHGRLRLVELGELVNVGRGQTRRKRSSILWQLSSTKGTTDGSQDRKA